MKYCSIDLETTGLEADKDQILMASFVVEDTEKNIPLKDLPHCTIFLRHQRYSGNAYALQLNAWILKKLSGNNKMDSETGYLIYNNYIDVFGGGDNGWVDHISSFLRDHFGDRRIVAAGKNVAGFDLPFLPASLQNMFMYRVIDPGSVFIDWKQDRPYSLPDLKSELGIDEGIVTHDARDDALDVINTLRESYGYNGNYWNKE